MKPNKQPCAVCRNHKPLKPFEIRDDNGTLFTVTYICNCPYCGRFLEENYEKEVIKNDNQKILKPSL